MPNGRAIVVIAVALSCCSAAARSDDPANSVRPSLALPEPRVLAPLAVALAGLVHLGRGRRR